MLDCSEYSENCWRVLSGYVSFSHTVLFLQILFVYLFLYVQTKLCALVHPAVRDRVRTKMERDILADVNHPFVVKLHYGESARSFVSLRFPSLEKNPDFITVLLL